MEIVKYINKSYETKQAMVNLIFYVASGSEEVGGYGISLASIENILYEFETVKKYWNKNDEGRRQVRHVIVSFEEDAFCLEEVKELAWLIAGYYGDRFQVFYGIHSNTENLHIHFVINTVSFLDGKMFSEGYSDLQKVNSFVKELTKKYKINKYKYQLPLR